MSRLILPKIKLHHAFMPVLVNSNFDDDSIKKEQTNIETVWQHFPIVSLWEMF